jgi:hypothetical protein
MFYGHNQGYNHMSFFLVSLKIYPPIKILVLHRSSPLRYTYQNSVKLHPSLPLSNVHFSTCSSYPLSRHHSNNTSKGRNFIKLRIMQSFYRPICIYLVISTLILSSGLCRLPHFLFPPVLTKLVYCLP